MEGSHCSSRVTLFNKLRRAFCSRAVAGPDFPPDEVKQAYTSAIFYPDAAAYRRAYSPTEPCAVARPDSKPHACTFSRALVLAIAASDSIPHEEPEPRPVAFAVLGTNGDANPGADQGPFPGPDATPHAKPHSSPVLIADASALGPAHAPAHQRAHAEPLVAAVAAPKLGPHAGTDTEPHFGALAIAVVCTDPAPIKSSFAPAVGTALDFAYPVSFSSAQCRALIGAFVSPDPGAHSRAKSSSNGFPYPASLGSAFAWTFSASFGKSVSHPGAPAVTSAESSPHCGTHFCSYLCADKGPITTAVLPAFDAPDRHTNTFAQRPADSSALGAAFKPASAPALKPAIAAAYHEAHARAEPPAVASSDKPADAIPVALAHGPPQLRPVECAPAGSNSPADQGANACALGKAFVSAYCRP